MPNLERDRRAILRRLIDPLIAIAIFAFSLPFVYQLAISGFDPHHSGLLYKGALDVANGKILFLETFTQYGALTTYVQALALLIGGKRVTSILFTTALFYAVNYLLLYRISRRFLNRALSVTAVLFTLFLAPFYYWVFHPWSSVYAITFLMLSLEMLLCFFERKGVSAQIFAGLSGLSAVLSFWFRQPVGLVSVMAGFLCIGFFAVIHRRHADVRRRLLWSLLSFGIGALIALLAVLIPIIAMGALRDFARQSLGAMAGFAADRSNTDTFGVFGPIGMVLYDLFIAPLWNHQNLYLDGIFILLPVTALLIALGLAVRMIRATRKDPDFTPTPRDTLLVVFAVYAVANWHQYYPVDCYRHWSWGSFLCAPALFLLLRWGVAALLPRIKKPLFQKRLAYPIALTLALLLFCLPNALPRMIAATDKLQSEREQGTYENEYYHHLDGLYLDAALTEHYDTLFESVHKLQTTFPDTNIINVTENGIYAVFGENFCPMFNNSGTSFYEEYPTWLAAYIESDRPILIGPEAPADYCLWVEIKGDGGDPHHIYHDMPANIYLPAELYAQLTK